MIAVDIMGGDNAPHAIIEGAVRAARHGVPVLLCGAQEAITAMLPSDWKNLPINVQFCDEQIAMDEEPSRAVRKKKNSSLVCAMKAVADGTADAFFSAGNSGAVLVASVLFSGRVKGIHRPAVGAFLPTKSDSFFCIDIGGNVDCKPEHLYQFALMGHAYVQLAKHIAAPRIALLSNGHEPYKGSDAVKKTYQLLTESSFTFVGNIEARELGKDNVLDVLVCDGFTGNVLLKSIQGTASTLFSWIKDAADCSWWCKTLLWLNRGMFKTIKDRLDYAATGGALLLGVNHPVILAHGCSDMRAVENGILFAYQVRKERRVQKFNEKLLALMQDNLSILVDMARKNQVSQSQTPS